MVRNRNDDPNLTEVFEKVSRAAEKASGVKPKFWWEPEVGVKVPSKKLKKEVLKKFLFVRELGEYIQSVFETPLYSVIAITTMVALDLKNDLSKEEVRDILRGGK